MTYIYILINPHIFTNVINHENVKNQVNIYALCGNYKETKDKLSLRYITTLFEFKAKSKNRHTHTHTLRRERQR